MGGVILRVAKKESSEFFRYLRTAALASAIATTAYYNPELIHINRQPRVSLLRQEDIKLPSKEEEIKAKVDESFNQNGRWDDNYLRKLQKEYWNHINYTNLNRIQYKKEHPDADAPQGLSEFPNSVRRFMPIIKDSLSKAPNIVKAVESLDIDPATLVACIISQESRGYLFAISRTGAKGPMQINVEAEGEKLTEDQIRNIFVPEVNIPIGVRILEEKLQGGKKIKALSKKGRLNEALAAYSGGAHDYARKVLLFGKYFAEDGY